MTKNKKGEEKKQKKKRNDNKITRTARIGIRRTKKTTKNRIEEERTKSGKEQ